MSAAPKNVLVLAAHPDDEVLGCGGTIALHVRRGDLVTIKFMTDGVGARTAHGEAAADIVDERSAAAWKAAAVLGVSRLEFGSFPDNALDTCRLLDLAKAIEAVIEAVAPDVVYTHFTGDLNIDHELTHRAVLTALRPMAGRPNPSIFCFEVPSSTEWAGAHMRPAFRPARYVDISTVMDIKLEALRAYDTELRPFPHPRSIEAVTALATVRGAASGLQRAEAFVVEREIAGPEHL
jgi:LmbE family N-acetylglucosaminyl deacetylase